MKAFIGHISKREQVPITVAYCIEYEGKNRRVFMDDEGRYIYVGSDKVRVELVGEKI